MALVLVVDDEIGILRLLEDVLGDEGHKVVVAVNGRQAMERAADGRPDLVITDYMMPVMDGPALIAAMSTNETLADVPIILMSSLPETSVAAGTSGYKVFVRKPFKIFDLIDLVAEIVGAGEQ